MVPYRQFYHLLNIFEMCILYVEHVDINGNVAIQTC
jgi:hypothetical protein